MYVYVSASHAFRQLTTLNDNHHPYILGTFRAMDNTCIINLTYSLKSQFVINPIWYPDMDTVLCNPVHPNTCLHCAYFLLYYLYRVP